MRLVSFESGGDEHLGVEIAGRVVRATDLDRAAPATMSELLAAGQPGLDRLRSRVRDGAWDSAAALEGVRLLAPVPRPGKIVAIGRNYPDHAAEDHVPPPEEPVVFGKWPSCVIGPRDEIRWDAALTSRVDFEAELAVVIGARARRIGPEAALDHVLGFACLNDVSARDLQFGDVQWARGKSLDTFCPLGPAVVTLDELPDPNDLGIECIVNGRLMQAARTSEMFFSVPELVSYCSWSFSLEPGDVIATGTPGGVGHFRNPPQYLQHGDEVIVAIERVGVLTNRCRVEDRIESQTGVGR